MNVLIARACPYPDAEPGAQHAVVVGHRSMRWTAPGRESAEKHGRRDGDRDDLHGNAHCDTIQRAGIAGIVPAVLAAELRGALIPHAAAGAARVDDKGWPEFPEPTQGRRQLLLLLIARQLMFAYAQEVRQVTRPSASRSASPLIFWPLSRRSPVGIDVAFVRSTKWRIVDTLSECESGHGRGLAVVRRTYRPSNDVGSLGCGYPVPKSKCAVDRRRFARRR
jgi:hypothetical protein